MFQIRKIFTKPSGDIPDGKVTPVDFPSDECGVEFSNFETSHGVVAIS